MATSARPQTEFDEHAIENSELEELLERREEAKAGHTEYVAQHKAAATVIKNMNLAEGKHRVGRFQINVIQGEAREVEFTRGASKSFRVKVVENGASDGDD